MDGATPRLRIEGSCRRLGRDEVVRRCEHLLGGGTADDDFVVTLGGPAAINLLGDGLPDGQEYWLRVWAVRGLLWAGPGSGSALRGAVADEHWRVREMACKVVARHCVGDLLDHVSDLESDDVPRVRTAARRAAIRIIDADV